MRLVLVLLLSALALHGADEPAAGTLPLIAIWRSNEGRVPLQEREGPRLRVAIWPDGRFLVAKDPAKWELELQKGTLSADALAQLKKDLSASPAFELKRTCYLVPDAGCNSMLLKVEEKAALLQWDEMETPNFGINFNPTPGTLAFKACWKALNTLALRSCPPERTAQAGHFAIPENWLMLRWVRY